MAILKNMKNILSKIFGDIGSSIYHIVCKMIGFIIIMLIVGLIGTRCTKALSINDNQRTINETQLTMLENIAKRSKYKNYVITSDYVTSGYNNYMNYYLCLTDELLDTKDPIFLETKCDEMYRYNNYSNNYSFVEVVDDTLKLSNTIYYTNSFIASKSFYIILQIIVIILASFIIYVILCGVL